MDNFTTMSIDHFLSRVWRIISLIGLGVSLLFIYRGLPDPAAVHFGETGRGDGFLPKEEIFYLTAALITLLNVLALLLIKVVDKIPSEKLGFLFQAFQDKGASVVKKMVINWLHLLPALINTFLILVLRTLLLLNDQRTFDQDFGYVPMIGIIFLLLWLIYLPIRLFSLNKFTEEE